MSANFKQTLKTNGYSVSQPRKLVFSYLQSHDNVTIHDLITHHIGKMNQASIYRCLNIFRELGIAHDSLLGGEKIIELNDNFKHHHHHISCMSCKNTACIHDAEIERRLNELAKKHGFRQVSHQLGINGYCQNCQAASSH